MRKVLILVVVEDVLVHENGNEEKANNSLNPCCGGRCSSTMQPGMQQGMQPGS